MNINIMHLLDIGERSIQMEIKVNGYAYAGQANNGKGLNGKIIANPEKKSVFVMNKDGTQTENVYVNGKLQSSVTRYDRNKDGKFDDKEMYYVDRYYYQDNGDATIKRFVDKDGDGYNDSVTTFEYDKDRNLKSSITKDEEDINDVKNRDHLDYEVHNRQMTAHKDGIYIY